MFDDEDDFLAKDFRKKKEKKGIKGYIFLIIATVILSFSLYIGILIRESISLLDFINEAPPPTVITAPSVTQKGINLN